MFDQWPMNTAFSIASHNSYHINTMKECAFLSWHRIAETLEAYIGLHIRGIYHLQCMCGTPKLIMGFACEYIYQDRKGFSNNNFEIGNLADVSTECFRL